MDADAASGVGTCATGAKRPAASTARARSRAATWSPASSRSCGAPASANDHKRRPLAANLKSHLHAGLPWALEQAADRVLLAFRPIATLATLRDLTPAQAAATPIAGAHSIWTLALHLDTWQRVVARRLAGDDSPVGDAENLSGRPAAGSGGWGATLARLAESDAAIRAAVIASESARLDPGSDRFDERLYRNVLGAISHLAWHAGQIAILRRAQGLEPTEPEA